MGQRNGPFPSLAEQDCLMQGLGPHLARGFRLGGQGKAGREKNKQNLS